MAQGGKIKKNLGPISSPGVENVKSNKYNGTVECR